MARALLSTNHFFRLAGSEVVIIEIAEYFRASGWDVTLLANEIAPRMRSFLEPLGVDLSDDHALAEISDLSLVWSQHHNLPFILPRIVEQARRTGRWPAFVFVHLSSREPLEVPGPFIESRIADLILANSPETADGLARYGAPFDQAKVFANPAPEGFSAVADTRRPGKALKRLLVVSNHVPSELGKALAIVARRGVAVTRVGRQTWEKRVTPEMIAAHDAVVAIGKTVQYALRARRPVFCYDQFGGPGWLTSKKFEASAWHNFSGRDHPIRRDPSELAAEILEGYTHGLDFSQGIQGDRLAPFCLDSEMQAVISTIESSEGERAARLDAAFADKSFQEMCLHEAKIAELCVREFTHRRKLQRLFEVKAMLMNLANRTRRGLSGKRELSRDI